MRGFGAVPFLRLGSAGVVHVGGRATVAGNADRVLPIPRRLGGGTGRPSQSGLSGAGCRVRRAAVPVEPFSVAVHAALKAPPSPKSKVLIVGAGSIGLLVLAALRLLGNKAHVTVLARHEIQEQMAKRFGADVVLRGKGAGDAATQIAGAKRYKPIKGKPVYAGGFDWVFDAVGSARSVDESLRVAGPHGRVVLVGCAAELPHLDLSFVWARELQITGCYVYGNEPSRRSTDTFDVAMRLLTEHPEFPLADLVTHTVPLATWREALRLSLQRGHHGAIKVVFDCRRAGSR